MNALELKNMDAVQVAIAPTAYEKRDALLTESVAITAIEDALDYQMAVDFLRKIKAMKAGVEGSRTQIKAPVLDTGRKIDSLAKDFIAPLDPVEARITGLIKTHERKQREIAEAAERQRQAELQAIENARLAAEREARAKAEAAQAAARTEQERVAAAARANAELKRLADQAIVQQEKAQATALALPASRPQGVSAKVVYKFTVTDIKAVYAMHPEFVELTIKKSAVNTALDAGLRDCPGLNIFKDESIRV
jgi:hypothetical protein